MHTTKEGPLSPAVGRPPSFSRPKLADRCKTIAKEIDAVDQTGERLAELKPKAEVLTSEVSGQCFLWVFGVGLRYLERLVKHKV